MSDLSGACRRKGILCPELVFPFSLTGFKKLWRGNKFCSSLFVDSEYGILLFHKTHPIGEIWLSFFAAKHNTWF